MGFSNFLTVFFNIDEYKMKMKIYNYQIKLRVIFEFSWKQISKYIMAFTKSISISSGIDYRMYFT